MSHTAMTATGRLTLPKEARDALGLTGEVTFDVEVDAEGDAIVLRPAVLMRREDAWAYTSEHRALLEAAHADSAAGRVRRMTESELAALGERG